MKPTKKTKVTRAPKRGHYDRSTIYKILDDDFICQIGFVHENYPVVIPTIYGRSEDNLYVHGATVSRMLKNLEKGISISVNVTKTDGIVLARSAFHHSLNYRSVTIFGTGTLVDNEEERLRALKIISDQVIPGRWEEVRAPNRKEMKATKIIRIHISEASAKIRTGPPVDDKEDYNLPIWAGVVPFEQEIGTPIPDPEMKMNTVVPKSVQSLINKKDGQ